MMIRLLGNDVEVGLNNYILFITSSLIKVYHSDSKQWVFQQVIVFRNSYDLGNNFSLTMKEKAAAHFKEAFLFLKIK